MPTASWTDFQNVTIPIDRREGRRQAVLHVPRRRAPRTRPTCSTSTSSRSSARASRRTRRRPRRRPADKVAGPAPLAVSFTGTGADADGDTLTYAWDFTNDGTTDATTANASHTYSQAGQYTAKFTVSDGERSRSVTIAIEAYPPLASCPGNDQFDGTTLDTSRWSVVRRDDQFLSVANGSLNLNAQPGEDIHGGTTGQRNIVLQDLPDSGPWTATARMTWNPTRQLPERRPPDLRGRRELDQDRHGVERQSHVRGVQGAQQHSVRASGRRLPAPGSRPRTTCASRATAPPSARSARRTARRGRTRATPPTSTVSTTRRSACTRRRRPPRARSPSRRSSTTSRSTRRSTRVTSSTARRSTSAAGRRTSGTSRAATRSAAAT